MVPRCIGKRHNKSANMTMQCWHALVRKMNEIFWETIVMIHIHGDAGLDINGRMVSELLSFDSLALSIM